jgi:hypothetical protein
VELPEHRVLLAEGLPAESYLDTGNRSAFANGGAAGDGEGAAPVMAHSDFARAVWERRGCAPLVLGGPMLALVQRRLLVQAMALGYRLGEEPRGSGRRGARSSRRDLLAPLLSPSLVRRLRCQT